MSAEEQTVMTKSARQRANKKARDAEAAAEAAPPAPAPKAAGKAKAKAEAAPAPEAKAKAKGKAKAAAAPEPAPAPKAEAKAKGKAKAEAEPAPKAEAAAKPKAKSKAKAKKEEEPVKVKEPELGFIEMDDGKGGDWEVASAVSKKQLKQQEKRDAQKKQEEEEKKALKAAGVNAGKAVPGMAPKAEVIAQAKAKGKAEPKTQDVTAPSAAVVAAKEAAAAVAAKAAAPAAPVVVDNSITATVKVPQEKIGRVIGPKGANIALIKEKTGVKSIDTSDELVTIVGDEQDGVTLAAHAVQELVDKGYMSMSFEDFNSDEVSVNPFAIPSIIGPGGAIIQVIKKECKVEINIPPTPKTAVAGRKVKVSVAGDKAGVEKAKEIINSIAQFSHHEITHPGFSHAELEVDQEKYRFLIGRGGSEMRHIQNSYKVKVNIPREDSETDKVVVIGIENDVERAVKYIEKILFEADQPREDKRAEKSEDTWGDEEPEESWMSPYMYKRR